MKIKSILLFISLFISFGTCGLAMRSEKEKLCVKKIPDDLPYNCLGVVIDFLSTTEDFFRARCVSRAFCCAADFYNYRDLVWELCNSGGESDEKHTERAENFFNSFEKYNKRLDTDSSGGMFHWMYLIIHFRFDLGIEKHFSKGIDFKRVKGFASPPLKREYRDGKFYKEFPNLKELTLYDLPLEMEFKHCPRLRKLFIVGGDNFFDRLDSNERLVAKLNELEFFEVEAKRWENFKNVNLSNLRKLKAFWIYGGVVFSCEQFKPLKNLEELCLYYYYSDEPLASNDVSLTGVCFKDFTKLKILELAVSCLSKEETEVLEKNLSNGLSLEQLKVYNMPFLSGSFLPFLLKLKEFFYNDDCPGIQIHYLWSVKRYVDIFTKKKVGGCSVVVKLFAKEKIKGFEKMEW